MDDQNTTSDETDFKQDLKNTKPEKVIIDAGVVVMMMNIEGNGLVPVPVTAVFQQLFSIINHLDSRVCKCEEKIGPTAEGNQIITLN